MSPRASAVCYVRRREDVLDSQHVRGHVCVHVLHDGMRVYDDSLKTYLLASTCVGMC
jgi:hypothetical protein